MPSSTSVSSTALNLQWAEWTKISNKKAENSLLGNIRLNDT